MKKHISSKYLKGERVFLREMTLDDAQIVVEWRNDPDIKKWMFNQEAITIEEHIIWFQNKKNRIDFMICDLKTKRPIGTLNFTNIKNNEAEAGKMLGDKSYWGGGYAKEAFLMWIDYGFNYFNFKKIIVQTMVTNISNIKLNEKLGFLEVNKQNLKISSGEEIEFVLMEKRN
ncbi:GNAT family N-acetyltransferase [Flavobacterium croceum]|uniref:GNAT family N-acetyltransferase n=1 Tax=Flavobacterium croceum TaxID=370975 RepID=UPI0024A9831E|nr:GNAT family N-acetyltransferase [Flavobacterium croceum]